MTKILFVDDDPVTLEMLSKAVGLHGHTAVTGNTAEKALALGASEHPDVILLDMNMPGTDGIAIIRQLRGQPETSAIPILMLSASPEIDMEAQVRAAGGQGYLHKPINLKQLIEVIREHSPS